ADVFAIACVLYRCVTGRGPFNADDAVATLAKVLFHEPEPASSLRKGVPRALDEVLARAMNKERGKRPASARAFAAELRALDRGDEGQPGSQDKLLALSGGEASGVSGRI